MSAHRLRLTSFLFLTAALALTRTLAADAFILSQDKKGTATVYVSSDSKQAVIIDGGKTGGLTAPRIEGQSVMEYLRGRSVEELVIVCSHPHDDHAEGIREVIRTDPRLLDFTNITFVESGYPTNETLYAFFRKQYPDFPESQVASVSARHTDALTSILNSKGLSGSNFVYEPAAKATAHGHSIISQIKLSTDAGEVLIVDFDDADTALVNKWAAWARSDLALRKPDIVIAPHHGSDLTDTRTILKEDLRPRYGIMTANGANEHLHPGPQNLRRWIDAVKFENVMVTGSSGTIHITPEAVVAEAGSASKGQLIRKVLRPQLASIERELLTIEDRGLTHALTTRETKRTELLRGRRAEVLTTLSKLEGDAPPPIKLALSKPPALPTPSPDGIPTNAVDPYTGAFRAILEESHKSMPVPDTSAPPAGSSGGIPSQGPPTGGTGTQRPPGGGGGRGVTFRRGFSMRPVWGGVIIGNGSDDNSDKVVAARFIENGTSIEIEVTVKRNGELLQGIVDGFTPSELWSAYNFVQPSEAFRTSYKLRADDSGLVGMSKNRDTAWDFAVHPAVAGTLIARDAMRLDMGIVAGKHSQAFPANSIPDFSTYQWYDESATVVVEDGTVVVEANAPPRSVLMRVRLWMEPDPPLQLLTDATREFEKKYGRPPNRVNPDDLKGVSVLYRAALQKWSATHPGKPVTWNCAALIDTFNQRFDAFRRVERFARLVAVLNWTIDGTEKPLPPLPPSVKPARSAIEPSMAMTDVFGSSAK